MAAHAVIADLQRPPGPAIRYRGAVPVAVPDRADVLSRSHDAGATDNARQALSRAVSRNRPMIGRSSLSLVSKLWATDVWERSALPTELHPGRDPRTARCRAPEEAVCRPVGTAVPGTVRAVLKPTR